MLSCQCCHMLLCALLRMLFLPGFDSDTYVCSLCIARSLEAAGVDEQAACQRIDYVRS